MSLLFLLSGIKKLKQQEEKQMREAIKLNFGGLQCDNPTCVYRDDSVKREDYEASVNKPCPECGESLLTPEGYKKVLEMEKKAEIMNNFINRLPKSIQKSILKEDSTHTRIPLKSDGEGNIIADMDKVYKDENVE